MNENGSQIWELCWIAWIGMLIPGKKKAHTKAYKLEKNHKYL